jgi:hypothetical protein
MSVANLRKALWELVPLFPVATSAVFCYLWLAQVVPASDSAEWITTIATVAALITAGVAAAAALGQLRLLRIDAEERAQDERKAQARRIYLTTNGPSLLEEPSEAKIVLYNNSTEPVDRIQLHLRTPGEVKDFFMGTLAPTGLSGESQPEIVEEIANKIRAWQGKLIDLGSASTGKVFWGPDCFQIRMTFRDSAGRWWLRREGYDLIEITRDVDNHMPRTPMGLSDLASRLTTHGL